MNENEKNDLYSRLMNIEAGYKVLEEGQERNEKMLTALFTKFDEFVRDSRRPLSAGTIFGAVSLFIMLIGALLAFVTYVSKADTAPMMAQMAQIAQAQQSMYSTLSSNVSGFQILQKEISVTNNRAESNEGTLEWFIFTEKIPQQITELNAKYDHLEYRINNINKGE